jgi:hypothetical protein
VIPVTVEKLVGPNVIGVPYRPREQWSSTSVLSYEAPFTVVPAIVKIVFLKCVLKAVEIGKESRDRPEIDGI